MLLLRDCFFFYTDCQSCLKCLKYPNEVKWCGAGASPSQQQQLWLDQFSCLFSAGFYIELFFFFFFTFKHWFLKHFSASCLFGCRATRSTSAGNCDAMMSNHDSQISVYMREQLIEFSGQVKIFLKTNKKTLNPDELKRRGRKGRRKGRRASRDAPGCWTVGCEAPPVHLHIFSSAAAYKHFPKVRRVIWMFLGMHKVLFCSTSCW